ncbi:MAG: hypothetical protein AB2417_04490 [Clostridiaceae bacterium]
MKKNYRMQKTISIKRFISELGKDFSDNIKDRLLDLEVRTVLTREEDYNILDIKHVEHTKYDCPSNLENGSSKHQKEYNYGQFVVVDEVLYFSEKCVENDEVMGSPVVNTIYDSLNTDNIIMDSGTSAKKVDDSNIDYVIDNILKACPEVSKEYMEIMEDMLSREKIKSPHRQIHR